MRGTQSPIWGQGFTNQTTLSAKQTPLPLREGGAFINAGEIMVHSLPGLRPRSIHAALILITAISYTGCSSSREKGADQDYPDFIPNGTPASYDRAELASNLRYPRQAREDGVEGEVILLVTILKTGEVSTTTVLRTDPDEGEYHDAFVDAAKEAVRETTFTPATQNGVAIDFRMTIRLAFTLE